MGANAADGWDDGYGSQMMGDTPGWIPLGLTSRRVITNTNSHSRRCTKPNYYVESAGGHERYSQTNHVSLCITQFASEIRGEETITYIGH